MNRQLTKSKIDSSSVGSVRPKWNDRQVNIMKDRNTARLNDIEKAKEYKRIDDINWTRGVVELEPGRRDKTYGTEGKVLPERLKPQNIDPLTTLANILLGERYTPKRQKEDKKNSNAGAPPNVEAPVEDPNAPAAGDQIPRTDTTEEEQEVVNRGMERVNQAIENGRGYEIADRLDEDANQLARGMFEFTRAIQAPPDSSMAPQALPDPTALMRAQGTIIENQRRSEEFSQFMRGISSMPRHQQPPPHVIQQRIFDQIMQHNRAQNELSAVTGTIPAITTGVSPNSAQAPAEVQQPTRPQIGFGYVERLVQATVPALEAPPQNQITPIQTVGQLGGDDSMDVEDLTPRTAENPYVPTGPNILPGMLPTSGLMITSPEPNESDLENSMEIEIDARQFEEQRPMVREQTARQLTAAENRYTNIIDKLETAKTYFTSHKTKAEQYILNGQDVPKTVQDALARHARSIVKLYNQAQQFRGINTRYQRNLAVAYGSKVDALNNFLRTLRSRNSNAANNQAIRDAEFIRNAALIGEQGVHREIVETSRFNEEFHEPDDGDDSDVEEIPSLTDNSGPAPPQVEVISDDDDDVIDDVDDADVADGGDIGLEILDSIPLPANGMTRHLEGAVFNPNGGGGTRNDWERDVGRTIERIENSIPHISTRTKNANEIAEVADQIMHEFIGLVASTKEGSTNNGGDIIRREIDLFRDSATRVIQNIINNANNPRERNTWIENLRGKIKAAHHILKRVISNTANQARNNIVGAGYNRMLSDDAFSVAGASLGGVPKAAPVETAPPVANPIPATTAPAASVSTGSHRVEREDIVDFNKNPLEGKIDLNVNPGDTAAEFYSRDRSGREISDNELTLYNAHKKMIHDGFLTIDLDTYNKVVDFVADKERVGSQGEQILALKRIIHAGAVKYAKDNRKALKEGDTLPGTVISIDDFRQLITKPAGSQESEEVLVKLKNYLQVSSADVQNAFLKIARGSAGVAAGAGLVGVGAARFAVDRIGGGFTIAGGVTGIAAGGTDVIGGMIEASNAITGKLWTHSKNAFLRGYNMEGKGALNVIARTARGVRQFVGDKLVRKDLTQIAKGVLGTFSYITKSITGSNIYQKYFSKKKGSHPKPTPGMKTIEGSKRKREGDDSKTEHTAKEPKIEEVVTKGAASLSDSPRNMILTLRRRR